MEVLGHDLEYMPPPPAPKVGAEDQDLRTRQVQHVNGTINNGDKHAISGSGFGSHLWEKHRVAVMVVARMPLEPIPLHWKNEILLKLLKLDRNVVDGKAKPPLQEKFKVELLLLIRRALVRYVKTAAKDVVMVSAFPPF